MSEHMTWPQAVLLMRLGERVQRASEQSRRQVDVGDETIPVFVCGQEPCQLAHAWSKDETAVMVFQGVLSGQLFVPDDEHRSATDWVCV